MGYVSAPLALELAKTYNVVGYDIDETKINNLNNSIDTNNEIDDSLFQAARKNIIFIYGIFFRGIRNVYCYCSHTNK